jgi:hypothetical protein
LDQLEEQALNMAIVEGNLEGLIWLEENIYQDPELLLMLQNLPIPG